DDPSAEAIGPNAERQAKQSSRQNRRGSQEPELSRIQIELVVDRNARHPEHRPHRETNGEGPGGYEQDREISGLRHPCSCLPREMSASHQSSSPARAPALLFQLITRATTTVTARKGVIDCPASLFSPAHEASEYRPALTARDRARDRHGAQEQQDPVRAAQPGERDLWLGDRPV